MSKSTWCCNDNVWNFRNFMCLANHVHSTYYYRNSQINGLASKDEELISDLESQLSCWSNNQRKYTKRVPCQLLQNWDRKTSSLSTTSMSTSKNMDPIIFKRVLKCFFLNQRWLHYSYIRQVLDDPRWHPNFLKWFSTIYPCKLKFLLLPLLRWLRFLWRTFFFSFFLALLVTFF